jgi:hypothetical protein
MERAQELTRYLEGLRSDPDLSEATILAGMRLWELLRARRPGLAVPSACAGEVDRLMFSWRRKDERGEVTVYLEAEIFPTGAVEWFCTDRTPGGFDWYQEVESVGDLSDDLIELLRLFEA